MMVSTSCETSTTGRVDNDEPSSSMLVSDEDEFKTKKYDPKDKLFVCYSIYAKLLSERNGTIFKQSDPDGSWELTSKATRCLGDEEIVDGFFFVCFCTCAINLKCRILDGHWIPDAMQHQLIVMRMNLKKKPLFGYSIFDVL